jgi:uncharacterized membrane protein (DUF4010 family)
VGTCPQSGVSNFTPATLLDSVARPLGRGESVRNRLAEIRQPSQVAIARQVTWPCLATAETAQQNSIADNRLPSGRCNSVVNLTLNGYPRILPDSNIRSSPPTHRSNGATLFPPSENWSYLPTLERLALALALGLFVGLEREWRRKEAGLRSFGFAAMLGCLGALMGPNFALLSLALLGVLVVILNVQPLRANENAKLATSSALLVVGFAGVLCGMGHTLTPTAVAVLSAALLAWKKPMAGFSIGLSEPELRSAILLAILAFVIYPGLPAEPVDPWGLIEPRAAWVTVILIAAIGFANYILLKVYGAKGVELAGFLGGLVNSTVTVAELANRVRATPALADTAYRGVMLATAAMIVRNTVVLGILAPKAVIYFAPAFGLMLAACLLMAFGRGRIAVAGETEMPPLPMTSPFSLQSTLKFGLIFLVLQVTGTLAAALLGRFGFFAVSLAGGFVSSASAVASAGALAAKGTISPNAAGVGAVLASLMSALVNLPVVARICHDRRLPRRLFWSLGVVVAAGIVGALLGEKVPPTAIDYIQEHLAAIVTPHD